MNKSERPFQNAPSTFHSHLQTVTKMRSGHRSRGRGAVPNRGHRARTAARVAPKGLRGDLRAFPRPHRPYTALGQGKPPPACPRASARVWVFLRLRSEMQPRLSGEGAARLPAGALSAPRAGPPRGSSPRSADKGPRVGRTYLLALPAKKRPNQHQGKLSWCWGQPQQRDSSGAGRGEKGLALRASLKGASAQRGRGKRTKNPPKTVTKPT